MSTPHMGVSAVNGLAELLVVDPAASDYVPVLRGSYHVTVTSSAEIALEQLRRMTPVALVTELSLPDGSPLTLCERAHHLSTPPALLVTTNEPERVPDALIAGCDSVLLKPFAPNLLYARLGRLVRLQLRLHSETRRRLARRQLAKAAHLIERKDLLEADCTRMWATTHCPYCNHKGVTSFEYASHRRAWYACLACKQVWLAKPREERGGKVNKDA